MATRYKGFSIELDQDQEFRVYNAITGTLVGIFSSEPDAIEHIDSLESCEHEEISGDECRACGKVFDHDYLTKLFQP